MDKPSVEEFYGEDLVEEINSILEEGFASLTGDDLAFVSAVCEENRAAAVQHMIDHEDQIPF